jgi:hypothetical protein
MQTYVIEPFEIPSLGKESQHLGKVTALPKFRLYFFRMACEIGTAIFILLT